MPSVARPVRHASGSPGSDGIRASSPAVVAAAPDSASLVRQVAPLSTMPMLTRPPGTGAIPQYAPSGSTTMRASLGPATGVVLDVPRQSRPAGQRGRAHDARGLRDDRPRPVCADHDPRRNGFARVVVLDREPRMPVPPADLDASHGGAQAHGRARPPRQREQRGVER